MRLALLSDPDNFHTDKWGQALVRAGIEVKVYSFNAQRQPGLDAVQLPLPAICGGKLSYLAYLAGGRVLREALAKDRIDAVNALNVTPFGVWANRAGFHPWVASAMGADILEFLPAHMLPAGLSGRSWENVEGSRHGFAALKAALGRPLYRRWVARALQGADWITADNQTLMDAIHTGFGIDPEKTGLLRWGLEPGLFLPDTPVQEDLQKLLGLVPGRKLILSPRGLKPVYQADVILAGFCRMLQQGVRDCSLVMLSAGYGVSSRTQTLAEEARKLGGHVVMVQEALDRKQMAQLWGMVDVFISAPVYDGYSAALAEGRFAGAVPIVNAIPGNLELIRHNENGWICDPFSPEKLAMDLVHVLEHLEALKDRFAEVNRKWILAHSLVDQNARLFADRLEKLRHGNPRPASFP